MLLWLILVVLIRLKILVFLREVFVFRSFVLSFLKLMVLLLLLFNFVKIFFKFVIFFFESVFVMIWIVSFFSLFSVVNCFIWNWISEVIGLYGVILFFWIYGCFRILCVFNCFFGLGFSIFWIKFLVFLEMFGYGLVLKFGGFVFIIFLNIFCIVLV